MLYLSQRYFVSRKAIEETFLSFQFPFFHFGSEAVDALAFHARFETDVIRLTEGLAAIAGLPTVYDVGLANKGAAHGNEIRGSIV